MSADRDDGKQHRPSLRDAHLDLGGTTRSETVLHPRPGRRRRTAAATASPAPQHRHRLDRPAAVSRKEAAVDRKEGAVLHRQDHPNRQHQGEDGLALLSARLTPGTHQ